jgi:hypothetical protein
MKFIYCRGGDKSAPTIAEQTGMLYGIRYDYTAYADIYMLDGGLSPRWSTYIRKVRKLRPQFALVPDYYKSDTIALNLYIQDLRSLGVVKIGVCPKFAGAIAEIPQDSDIVLCISIPTVYAGFLPDSSELRPQDYHLLGGDIRAQLSEAKRIKKHGGRVVSMDGNKLAMKAAHGQIFDGRRWVKVQDTTFNNALVSAQNIMQALND